jgi:AcrR family transcriptional regulator
VPPAPPPSPANRDRLLGAAYACVARYGLAKTTMEDVGREAGLSRATLYRYFPGGKDQIVRDVVAWETARFFDELTRAVAAETDIVALLTETLLFAHRAVEEHEVLQKILETEPERLLPLLTVESNTLVLLVKRFLLLALQRAPLRPGVDADAAGEYLARMVLSHVGGQGRWDLTDRASVDRLVRRQFLGGLLSD